MSKLLSLFRGKTLYEQHSDAYSDEIIDRLVHLDTAGAYAGRDAYLVLDREGDPIEPIDIQVDIQAGAGAATQTGEIGVILEDIYSDHGVTIAVGTSGIYKSEDDGLTWTQVDGTSSPNRVHYGSGVWIAARGTVGDVMRSTDDGETWTEIEVSSAVGAKVIYAFHVLGSTWVAVGNRIWHSTDGGENWTQVDDLDHAGVSWEINDVAYDHRRGNGNGIVVAPANFTIPHETFQHVFVSADLGATWTTVEAQSGQLGSQFKVEGGAGSIDYATDGEGTLLLAGVGNGRITLATPATTFTTPFVNEIYNFGAASTLTDTYIVLMRYNSVAKRWVAVGRTLTPGEPRIWHSPDGNQWTRVTGVEDDMMAAGASFVNSVTFTEDGYEIYIGNAEVAFISGETFGLREGSYNVYAISYFNTPAGRLVCSLSRTTLNFVAEFGGSIDIRAPLLAEIEANNPWLAQIDSSTKDRILADLRYDVYIQQVAEAIDGVVPETTIRYAFTEPFPESGDGSPQRTIDEMPLGRQVVSRGLPTTSVLERSLTALHNGRIWGMAHQDETMWHVDEDGISPEIANQANRFVLCYTETGWANLMSDQSFIPIQPTQSSNFTGLVSTPMGLLVCFDNEIHVVTGDPAFDNVTVDLFTNLVGNDYLLEEGRAVKPTKVGGMPFVTWAGKIWALSGQGAQEVSQGQWVDDDPFVQIVPEPQNRSLLALTRDNNVFRYIVDKQFWLTDVAGIPTLPATPIDLMLPNCVCESGDNTRFVVSESGSVPGAVYTTRRDGDPDTPYIAWNDIDFGMPERRKAFYLLKATFEGFDIMGRVYDRNDVNFDDTVVPLMYYFTNNSFNGEALPVLRYPNTVEDRHVGTLAWRTLVGQAKSDTFSIHLSLAGMGRYDAIRLPVKFFFSSGGELR